MRTGKYVFNSDGMRLCTLCDKSCNAVNVVYQIICAGCKQCETQDFHQRMNLHKSDIRILNTDCLPDLHINWCLNTKYEHVTIPYLFIGCTFITVALYVNSGWVKDQNYFRRILKSELNPLKLLFR